MSRILLNDVSTWVRLPKRKGPTVVLLHGGLSSSASLLRVLGPGLSRHFEVAAFDRRGHGRSADTSAPFSYDSMAEETVAFLSLLGRRVFLIGHSDGANVALLVALARPDLVKRVVMVGGNYHHGGLVAMDDFTPASPGFDDFAQQFGERSPDGAAHAAAVVTKSLALVKEQPTLNVDELRAMRVPVLVLSGDDDVVTLAHTISMYEAFPEAQLAILPGTSHAILKEKTDTCVRLITKFLRGPVPPRTKYPIRRAIKSETE